MFTEDSISLVSGFLLFCLFGLGAFALSRFIGKYGKAFQKGRYMKVVDQIQIAQTAVYSSLREGGPLSTSGFRTGRRTTHYRVKGRI